MKTKNAEYIERHRKRKKEQGLVKLPDKWIYPIDKRRIDLFIYNVTEETKKSLDIT